MGILYLIVTYLACFSIGFTVALIIYHKSYLKLSTLFRTQIQNNALLSQDLETMRTTCMELQIKVDKFENDKENDNEKEEKKQL